MRVPGYEGGVKSSGLPGVRVNTSAPIEAFGGGAAAQGLTNATNQLLGQASDIAKKEKEKADDAAAQDAYAKLTKYENDLKYNPETGAFRRQGKDAGGIGEEYGQQFDKYADELEGGLTSSDQRAMFQRIRQKRRVDFDGDLLRHTFQQAKAYEEQASKSAIEATREDLVLNSKDPERLQRNMGLLKSQVMDFADKQGVSPETAKLMLMDETSKAHDGVIDDMLSRPSGYLEAKAYYGQVKGEISEKYRDRIEKALEEGGVRGESQRLADSIVSKSGSLSVALRAVKEIKDPKVRDETQRRIEHDFQQKKAAETELRDQQYTAAVNLLDKNPGANPRDLVSPKTWALMKPEHRDALQRRSEDPPNNNKVWMDFLALSEKEVAGLSRADFESKYWVNFDKERRSKAEAQWESTRNAQNNPAKDNSAKSLYTDKEMALAAFKTSSIAGVTPSDDMKSIGDSKAKAAAYAEFFDDFNKRVTNEARAKGVKEISDDRKQEILNDIAKTVFVRRTDFGIDWMDTDEKVAVSKLEKDDEGEAYVPIESIPEPNKNEMGNYIKSIGKSVTNDKLQRMRAARLIGDRDLYKKIAAE